jgi:hypothetical protein
VARVPDRRPHLFPSESLGFWTSSLSGILTNQKTRFGKKDLFSSAGEERETLTLLGPLEKVNLNHWIIQLLRLALPKEPKRVGVSLPSLEDENGSFILNVVFSS